MNGSGEAFKRGAYTAQERARAAAWKQRTATLPAEARLPAQFAGVGGRPRGRPYDFCLPLPYAEHNLLPEVRGPVLPLFDALGIPWHCGVNGGPGNHLLSSQVQCANALGQAVASPEGRLDVAFQPVLEVGELLDIENARRLTFEYVGEKDYLNESRSGHRTRGANCTSVDAAFLHRASDGNVELVLVEWKYTESYLRRRKDQPSSDEVRRARYLELLKHPDSPVSLTDIDFALLLDEPFYQLLRQQLLAWQIERDPTNGIDRARVVHVVSPANKDYQRSLVRDGHRQLGRDVGEVWSRLLHHPDRFDSLDSTVFLDPSVTSPEYVDRYGGPLS